MLLVFSRYKLWRQPAASRKPPAVYFEYPNNKMSEENVDAPTAEETEEVAETQEDSPKEADGEEVEKDLEKLSVEEDTKKDGDEEEEEIGEKLASP